MGGECPPVPGDGRRARGRQVRAKNIDEMKQSIAKQIIQAEDYLKARKDIGFAYLFGSLAENRATHLSDVDIAVYLTEGKLEDKRFEILGDLIDIFKTDRLDLVILNTAPLISKNEDHPGKKNFSG